MTSKDPTGWADWRAKNTDPYGNAVMEFAEQWATLMETQIANGARLEDIADATMREVDQRPGFGITGFMYGMAVSALSLGWVHGEDLRRWHNLETQIGTEGERANESGAVLNPALLNIETH